ncbi:metallophosphoesterase family protein [Vagococcus hydrophili]|uniref:DNA repair exonuclease n=1 Tax=Vagococcus hydrophili TaxID=2714947 RepID=A0A6G8ASA5_9ENTE|nr:DNA repair exonuclease [Vagococcus hydrophili]QIL47822.1 DNA repair exonuclease [Vagococcus hydrophili]
MKFIHTADLHIDQPFSGIDSDKTDIQTLLKTSNQDVLSEIVDRCLEEKVDFLLIVGDTFHQAQSSIHTQKAIMTQFERLEQAEIKVVLSFGNHDYYTKNRYWFEWPDNVILFKKEEVQTKTIQLKNGESVSISGFSYENQWINQSMAPFYPKRNFETTYHIGFYHGDNSKNYAPFTPSELPASYDYWALGHIHKSEILSTNPVVAYSGTPQGHTKKENQTKGVLLVEIKQGSVNHQWLDVSNIKWHKKEVSILETLDKKDLLVALEKELFTPANGFLLTVLEARLITTAENASLLLKEKEEVMMYLQDQLLRQSGNKLWLKDLGLNQSTSDKLIMGFETTLIDDLGRKYKAEDYFEKTVGDLMLQGTIAKYLSWEQEDMADLVNESSQLIKDKMIFKNEADQ